MCTKFFLAGTEVQWGEGDRLILLDDTSAGMMLSRIRYQHVEVWTWTGLPFLSLRICLHVYSVLSSNMHNIWLVLNFPEQKYCVRWKCHNKMVEKFQTTGSAMGHANNTFKTTAIQNSWHTRTLSSILGTKKPILVVVSRTGRQKTFFWDEAWFILNKYLCPKNPHAVNKLIFSHKSGVQRKHMLSGGRKKSVTFDYFCHYSWKINKIENVVSMCRTITLANTTNFNDDYTRGIFRKWLTCGLWSLRSPDLNLCTYERLYLKKPNYL